MRASTHILGAVAVLAALGAGASFAQSDYPHANGQEATGQSTAMPMMNSTVSPADAQASAMAAGHANGQEATGQSTAPKPMQSTMSSDQMHDQAVHAGHATGQEAPGQSTALPMSSHS
ncbi:hypothetical protein [Variovorax terrae]|uniref:Copper resistance protein CopB n=1 Tax=Variovorax terrae TaxID=2923278 RepID=A0A9X1VVV7_9BURK|nr:hypothetical protein [Variovorax terrae]MCJ0764761.1 hypothetical protein [Variovorax terrae]